MRPVLSQMSVSLLNMMNYDELSVCSAERIEEKLFILSFGIMRIVQAFKCLYVCYRRRRAVMLTAVAHVCLRRPNGHADRRPRVLLILPQVHKVKAREPPGLCPNTVPGELGPSMC